MVRDKPMVAIER